MSSVQTGQLISLLINNVLMVITVTLVALAAWFRWRWLQISDSTRVGRRRCRWAYVSFLLTLVTLLGMVASLSALALRAIVAVNQLVNGAMVCFLMGVLSLLAALGLWFWDMCSGVAIAPRRRHRQRPMDHAAPIRLLPMAVVAPTRRRRGERRSRYGSNNVKTLGRKRLS